MVSLAQDGIKRTAKYDKQIAKLSQRITPA